MSHSLLRSYFWSFLEQGGVKGIQLVIQVILARLLAPEAFGVLAILLVVTNVADSVAQSGLGTALVQKSDATAKSFSTAWWMSLSLALALYAGLFACAPIVASFYDMPDLVLLLRALSLVVPLNALNSIQRSYFQRKLDFKSIFRATTLAAFLSGAVGVTIAFFGWGIWALVAQVIAQSAVVCVVMWIQIDWRPSFEFDQYDAKELFGYGWKVGVTGILNVLYTGVSELVIGRACSASDLGLYSQGRKYPQAAIGVANNAIANVLLPSFAAVKNDKDELGRSMRKSLAMGCFVTVPLAVLAAVTAEPLVAVLLGGQWLDCVPVFGLMCLASAFTMLQLVNLRAYMALGDSSLYLRLQIIKVVLGGGVISAAALITHDIYATALVTFIVSVFSILLVDMPPAKRMHGYGALSQMRDQIPVYGLGVFAGVLAYLPTFAALPAPVLLAVQVAIYLCIYLGGAKVARMKELSYLAKIASDIIGKKKADGAIG